MWDDAFEDAQEAMGLSESLDNIGGFATPHFVECVGSFSTLQAELLSPQFHSSFKSFQDSISEQMAQLREEMAPLRGATAFDAMNQCAVLGGALQIPNAVDTGLGDHIESLRQAIPGDLEFVFARELAKLRPADIYEVGSFAEESPLATVQAMLKELALESGELSDGILGVTGLGRLASIPGVSGVLPDTSFKDSYLDDLRESFRDLYAEEFEHLNRVLSTVLPESEQPPNWRDYTSALGVATDVDLEKLGARHGTQFTVEQVLAFEAVARTAERLLSMRDRRKILSKLGYIFWAASFGSKLLRLYAGLLYILWHLLGKDLLATQKLGNKRLRRFVECLSPPPVQPLSRLPKVKPNAPNVAA